MRAAVFPDEGLQIDLDAVIGRKSRMEGGGGFAARLLQLMGLERALDDFGDGAAFAPHQPMGEVAGFGAADDELGRGHWIPQVQAKMIDKSPAIKMAGDGGTIAPPSVGSTRRRRVAPMISEFHAPQLKGGKLRTRKSGSFLND